MKWDEVFQDPKVVGEGEYTAIHDMLCGVLLGDDPQYADGVYPGDYVIPDANLPMVIGALSEFKGWAEILAKRVSVHVDNGTVALAPAENVVDTMTEHVPPDFDPNRGSQVDEIPSGVVPAPDQIGSGPYQPAEIASEIHVYKGEGPMAPEKSGEDLIVTVVADSIEKLQGAEAKRVAFEARGDYGYANGGITKHSGPFALDEAYQEDHRLTTSNRPYAHWGMRFTYTRGFA